MTGLICDVAVIFIFIWTQLYAYVNLEKNRSQHLGKETLLGVHCGTLGGAGGEEEEWLRWGHGLASVKQPSASLTRRKYDLSVGADIYYWHLVEAALSLNVHRVNPSRNVNPQQKTANRNKLKIRGIRHKSVNRRHCRKDIEKPYLHTKTERLLPSLHHLLARFEYGKASGNPLHFKCQFGAYQFL